MAEREKQWTAYWAPKMCTNDGTQSEIEFEASILREKKLWWRRTFGEDYAPQLLKHPVIFGCASCDKLFPTRRGCNAHMETEHDIPVQPEGAEHMSTAARLILSMAAKLSKPERAKLLFHPQATEEELKACLFANLPWQDKAMLPSGMSPADMDLCRVTKTLVLRPPRHEPYSSLSAW
jgi:hypothetical protein